MKTFLFLLTLSALVIGALVFTYHHGHPAQREFFQMIWEHRNSHFFFGLLAYTPLGVLVVAPVAAWFERT